jgi:hypothetical protein
MAKLSNCTPVKKKGSKQICTESVGLSLSGTRYLNLRSFLPYVYQLGNLYVPLRFQYQIPFLTAEIFMAYWMDGQIFHHLGEYWKKILGSNYLTVLWGISTSGLDLAMILNLTVNNSLSSFRKTIVFFFSRVSFFTNMGSCEAFFFSLFDVSKKEGTAHASLTPWILDSRR